MKKLFLCVIVTTALVGCGKRDYSCKCDINGGNYETIIKNTTQSKAMEQCKEKAKSVGQKQGTYYYECTVK